MCIIFSLLMPDRFLILRGTEWDIIKNLYWSSYNAPVNHVRFQLNLNLLDWLPTNSQISDFMYIRPVGAELCHADRRTNRRADRHYEANDSLFEIYKVHSPTNALFIKLVNFKIYIKIHTNIAPKYFGLRPSSGSLHWTGLKLYLC